MQAKPRVVYYRWVYSPSTGDVTLAHNHEGHPAMIRFHADLANARPEKDIEAGYAFKLDNGFKVTDQDFKPVDDPHRMVAVENAISSYESEADRDDGASQATPGSSHP